MTTHETKKNFLKKKTKDPRITKLTTRQVSYMGQEIDNLKQQHQAWPHHMQALCAGWLLWDLHANMPLDYYMRDLKDIIILLQKCEQVPKTHAGFIGTLSDIYDMFYTASDLHLVKTN